MRKAIVSYDKDHILPVIGVDRLLLLQMPATLEGITIPLQTYAIPTSLLNS